MRAVVFKGKNNVAVGDVPDPRLEAPDDAIVRITSAAICGSDLHMYEERSSAKPGTVFGHENMGVVEETGSAVHSIRKGDRVVLPFNIACGFCFNCTRGYTNACLTANPGGTIAKPSFIVSHRMPLSQAPEAYKLFDMRGVDKGRDFTKVVLKPGLDRAA